MSHSVPTSSASTTSPSTVAVGVRVQFKRAIGTVRYVGELRGQATGVLWVGVEWDDISRGKHSGTHEGIHYFSTLVPNAGSFVKLSKLGPRRSLLQAAQLRYQDAVDNAHRGAGRVYVQGGRLFDIAEEGTRVGRLEDISVLDVSGLGVCSLGMENEVKKILGDNVTHLTVAQSLFDSIDSITALLAALPNIVFLDVSSNCFSDPDPDPDSDPSDIREKGHEGQQCEESGEEHAHLKQLILNRCSLSWTAILHVCARIEHLEQLRLHRCNLPSFLLLPTQSSGISSLPLPSPTSNIIDHWAALTVLDLDENHLTWSDVSKLAALPTLQQLFLSKNNLPDCSPTTTSTTTTTASNPEHLLLPPFPSNPFPRLHTLSIEHNDIRGWSFLTWLHHVSGLRHLRACGNPGLEGGYYRMRTIARVGSLIRLDGSDISVDERLQAERRYVRDEVGPLIRTMGMDATTKTGYGREHVQHPRAKELFDLYADTVGISEGNGGDIDDNDARVATLRHSTVRCTLRVASTPALSPASPSHGRNGYKSSITVRAGRQSAVRVLPRSLDTEQIETVLRTVLRVDVRNRDARKGKEERKGDGKCAAEWKMSSPGSRKVKLKMNVSVTDADATSRTVAMTEGLVLGSVLGTHFNAVTIECVGMHE